MKITSGSPTFAIWRRVVSAGFVAGIVAGATLFWFGSVSDTRADGNGSTDQCKTAGNVDGNEDLLVAAAPAG